MTGGRIHLGLGRDTSLNQVIFSVQDNGIGIAAEILPRLFIMYERGSKKAKLTAGGSGIGLYLTKQIVEMHGGRIWAESPGEGHGSTFSFSVPV